MFKRLLILAFFTCSLCASALAGERAAEPAPGLHEGPVRIVASFSILGDMIRQVGGQAVDLRVLVGPNADAHTFQPTPQNAKDMVDAEIIAINGLKFEGWVSRLVAASGTHAKLLVASAGLRPRIMEEEGRVIADPHAWQDLRNAQIYVRNIAAALIEARPQWAEKIRERAQNYNAKLAALDAETREKIGAIPQDRRKIITNHDAFGYFAAAYGIKFLAPVGFSTEAEPSAADVAKLDKLVKDENIKEIFFENMTDSRLIEQIGKDTGAKIGGTLYADALSPPNGEAPTYIDMFKINVARILGAME